MEKEFVGSCEDCNEPVKFGEGVYLGNNKQVHTKCFKGYKR